MFSAPDLNTPKHPLKLSTLSLIPTSLSQSATTPPCDPFLLSNSPLSSSIATFDRRNSYSRIPGLPPISLISAATLCCSLAVDIMNPDPNSKHPSYPPIRKFDSGQQYTNPQSNIMSSSELTFLIAYRTPLNPLKPLSFDSIDTFSSNRSDSGWILVSIKALFSSSNPRASRRHPEIVRITCSKNSIK